MARMSEEQALTHVAAQWGAYGFQVEANAQGLVIQWGDDEVAHGDADSAMDALEMLTGRVFHRPWRQDDTGPQTA